MRSGGKLTRIVLLLIASAGWALAAQADTLQLQLTETSKAGNPTSGIKTSTDGSVGFSGILGDFSLNIATGVGSPNSPEGTLDLNSIDVVPTNNTACSSSAPCVLQLLLTETGITPPFGNGSPFAISWGGTQAAGTVSFSGYVDPGNAAFGTTDSLGSLSSTSKSNNFGFSGGFNNGQFIGLSGPYSITELVTISVNGPGTTSFDATVSPVPEPGSLLLLGAGLLGVTSTIRKKLLK